MAQIQLAALGAQDIYLTNNPSISFFRHTYKQYSNFSIEAFKLNFINTKIQFGQNNNIKIGRHADLISSLYLNLQIKAKNTNKRWGWISNLGNNLINYVELKIGGNSIDKIYGSWLNIWSELTLKKELINSYNEMIGNTNINKKIMKDVNTRTINLFIPIFFFFSKFNGLALPLIALQKMEVEINFNLKEYKYCINSDYDMTDNDWDIKPEITQNFLIVDYIYLDNAERSIFAKSNHELLIEQLTYEQIPLNSNNNEYNSLLHFKHLCKTLYWTINMNKYIDNKHKNENIFLGEDLTTATIRFILIAVCSTGSSTTPITAIITAGSIFKITSEYKIETYNKSGSTYSIGTETILNNTYTYYTKIKDIIENCIITKDIIINSSLISDVDISYITINKYLDNNTYSLQIKDILVNGKDIIECGKVISNTTNPFDTISRSSVSGGIGLANYDIKLYNYNNYGLYLDNNENPLNELQFKYNGIDRIDSLDSKYYNFVQPYFYHNNIPPDGINMYSFSLSPEDFQPSGTSNLSNINNIELIFKTNTEITSSNSAILNIYSINYNLLRITSGVGGLRFS